MAISLSLPANSNIKVVGITNSGSWSQCILINKTEWTGKGEQNNSIIGTMVLPSTASNSTIHVDMSYDDGNGFKSSQMLVEPFSSPGLEGYVVGGQDGGGRSSGPAYWNTMALIYWAKNY